MANDQLWLPGLNDLRRVAREGIQRASASVAADGIPGSDGRGQLIRPLLAIAGSTSLAPPSARFWDAALAVQLAHEASLLHDDVIDAAATRRGEPTLAASRGVARALLRGDHLLTSAYRAAARTGSIEFVQLFARAVERTVAGEGAQGACAGEVLDLERARELSLGKSGELMGCSLATGAVLEGRSDAAEVFELGRRIGLLYQMLDDLLDYCPGFDTGKPALGDYASGRWTWPLSECPSLPLGLDPREAARRLHRPTGGSSPMRQALSKLQKLTDELEMEANAVLPHAEVLRPMLLEWLKSAAAAVEAEARSVSQAEPSAADGWRDEPAQTSPASYSGSGTHASVAAETSGIHAEIVRRVPSPDSLGGYLATNSRSFRFASRFFTAADAERVARVYAFCRITDDLVDSPSPGFEAEDLLDAWVELSEQAYEGRSSGIPLLDEVIGEMSEGSVPFSCVAELAEGMRMDLRGERYASPADLRRYTYRVASVVGIWLTRLWGFHDPRVLEGAERLGHAMQLTNILRDVGEDLSNGRLYLPLETMRAHGLDESDLLRMQESGRIDVNYRSLVEELMEVAEKDYTAALAVLPGLPLRFARAIAASAHIYRGIHAEIRRNGHDNLTSRAYTTQITKARLAMTALWELRRSSSMRATVSPTARVLVQGSRR